MKSTRPAPPSRHARALLLPPLFALAAATGSSPAAWAGSKTVPFTASVTTLETVRPDPAACNDNPPLYLAGSTTGSGVASQMGAITFAATDCISPGVPTYSFGNGRLTITAANGDQLKASYQGTLVPLPNPLQFQLFTAIGHFTVTGGTGRFQGASGSGYLQGFENIQTGQGQFNLVGVLSY